MVFTDSLIKITGCFPTRVGIDGRWIGAACQGTYVRANIEPGEHHLCTSLPGSKTAKYTALRTFTAEARKVYYFREEILDPSEGVTTVHLDTIDQDEGLLLLATRLASESKVK